MMQRYRLIASMVPAALLAVGCAAKNVSVGFTSPSGMSPITHAELEASGVSDPFDAVSLLRPGWLRPRVRTNHGQGRDGLPAVYVQNMRFGSVERLRDLAMERIAEIRYVHALDAATRWGKGHSSGVIEVIWQTQDYRP